jgi:protein ImuA
MPALRKLSKNRQKLMMGRHQSLVTPLAFAAEESGAEDFAAAPEKLLVSGFHELLGAAPGDETIRTAFALSIAASTLAGSGKGLCFCSLASEAQEYGALYGHGLSRLGIDPSRLIMVSARHEKDLLWTLEEAVGSGAFGAVIGALGSQERLYAFAQSRRLKLRVAANKTLFFLLRHWRSGGATAAHGRWRITARPSRSQAKHGRNRLLGPPRLQLTLERMASVRPQKWEMEFDAARGFHMVPLLEDGSSGVPGKRRHQAA